MSVALITWGRFFDAQGNKITVPAPSTDPGKPWLWDFLAAEIADLSQHFDALQLPPASKCQGGAGVGDDGYGVFDLRDLGSKNQQGSMPTRYGTQQSLLRLCAMAHASGMNVLLDIVLHQLIGSNGGPGVYKYLGSDGKTLNGRGLSTPGWFRGSPVPPFCNEDSVPVPFYDFAFGDEKSFQNCNPHRVTIDDALDFGDWIFRTTGGDGGRFDDAKGTWAPFVAEFMTSRAMAGKPFYSEYFDGNPSNLNNWATSSPMNGRSAVEDFDAHFAVQAACDGGNARALDGAGYLAFRPDLSVTFVDNPDTDTSYGEGVINAKLLGYAFLATVPSRMLMVYGKDYFGPEVWPGAYGLKPWIDNLMWISRTLAYGALTTQYVDSSVIVLQRNGDGGVVGTSPGLLTCLNFDTYNHRTITCPTTFWPGTRLHDFTGHHPDIWCDNQGNATFTIPPNAYQNGQSYLCFSWAGVGNAPVRMYPRSTTQQFDGAEDLAIGPAPPAPAPPLTVARLFCAASTWIHVRMHSPLGDAVAIELLNPDGTVVMSGGALDHQASATGWFTVTISSPTTAAVPFSMAVTYTAPTTIPAVTS